MKTENVALTFENSAGTGCTPGNNAEAEQSELKAEIQKLKQERQAVILAHFYQNKEIQEIADVIGDSFQLARVAQETKALVIVVAGVRFMAETAKMLNPEKLVLLPEPEAACPMAEMADAKGIRAYRREHPGALVVSYVNTTADVKAESDVCCTSANALEVLKSLEPGRPVLFVPDRNLGNYIALKTGRNMDLWDGYCPIHQRLTPEEITEARQKHPQAEVLVHPECDPQVVQLADQALGTNGMIKYVGASDADEFIIGTDVGLLHQLSALYPQKRFYLAAEHLICPDMKKISLEKILDTLKNLQPAVEVPADITYGARRALVNMIKIY